MNEKAPLPGRHRSVAEAQELLLARRAAMHLAREGHKESPLSCDPANPPRPGQQPAANSKQFAVDGRQVTTLADLATAVESLPDHLGWGSAAQTVILRAAARRHNNDLQVNREGDLSWLEKLRPAVAQSPVIEGETMFCAGGTVSLAPSLGLAILRHKQASGARLWLLLRSIDREGRGVITLDLARKAFTDLDSPLRFCGQRQLRNILASGGGLFWQIDDKRIWLRSAVRVAGALGVSRFRGQEIALPITALTGGIGAVRANLFASFHSGRNSKPIARQTLAQKSGIAPRTQRHYDTLSGVGKRTNYARGPVLGSKEAQEQAWQQGPASFAWREPRKNKGGQNKRFLAWQLPNSYHGPHARLGRGRRKRQNKALADLLNKGTAGNGHGHNDDLTARYFADARAASRAYGRVNTTIYWPAINPGIWHCLLLPAHEPAAKRESNR